MEYEVELHEVTPSAPGAALPKPQQVQGFRVRAETMDLARREVWAELRRRGHKKIRSVNLTGTEKVHRFYAIVERS